MFAWLCSWFKPDSDSEITICDDNDNNMFICVNIENVDKSSEIKSNP